MSVNDQSGLLMIFGPLLGVVVAEAFHLCGKWIDYTNHLKIKRLDVAVELEKKYLIEPVVSFIDRDLTLMQKAYGHFRESDESKRNSSVENIHVFELASVEARVKSIGDRHLEEEFGAFSRARITLSTAVADGTNEEAFTKLSEAISLAGRILELLFKRLRKIDQETKED